MNKYLFFLIPVLLYSCGEKSRTSPAQTDSAKTISGIKDTSRCSIDTLLRGGYQVFCMADDSLLRLMLKKDSIIKEIASASDKTSEKGLGYVKVDFSDHFVLLHSFDPGTVDFAELIEKKTGDAVLSGFYIDADKEKEFLLYGTPDPSGDDDKMILYNLKTMQKNTFDYPSGIKLIPKEKAIRIENIQENSLVISYETPQGKKIKTYRK
jgi:hypothetical protein